MQSHTITGYLNDLLQIDLYKDLCPNGLQVEGRNDIKKIVCGVSACVGLFEKAIEQKADAILVHHGIIWNFERPLYVGSYKKRVKFLLENNLNLLAYHLPLDAHAVYGNNVRIARKLGVEQVQPFGAYNGTTIGFKGTFNHSADELFNRVRTNINPQALIFPFGPKNIQRVGIISGGAQKEIKQAVVQGLDAYITGEVSEHIYHYAREEGIHFIAAGHHATEVFGVRALGKHLGNKFNLDVQFINIPNPV